MASKSALLRNIRPSGGLFTENILLRLRDNPERVNIGKIKLFVEEDSKEQRDQFKDKRRNIFDWCIQKWDEISPKIKDTLKEESLEKWSLDDLIQKWLIPFFEQFDYELETFEKNEENIDNDSPLNDFELSFQYKEYLNPFFQFVNIEEDLDFKISNNPQSKSHHNVCQQFINLNPEINWLFLSNGRILRILTKYYHSYSKGYLEFDLENIFANRDEKEFDTLYSIIHSSRFNSKVEDGTLLIDKFQKDSITEGVKIGDILRDNVEHALELLGNELIQQNLDKIDLDEIDVNEFYAELLRIIYRIIFILYAEQRDMLPGAGSLYFEQFSLSSLRIRAEKPIKAERNYDLWNKMLITFNLVRDGNLLLGVNSYNGSLFKEDNLRIILKNGMKISNDIVLKVIRLLTTSSNHKVRQRINFLEVSEEEIGAIYESLLDFKPYISSTLQFQLIEGTERKSTGSYYTPKALIDILIRTTLQPLVEDRLIKAGDDEHEREKAILDLKVCDPACGGGTFLLSALDFLGKKLAEVRTDTDSPLDDDLREARRKILQHCIYGVDMNPLAVELAKISLWLRACVKDKPLNFLDNHIKCGNSLIGLGQKTEITSIDPNAFRAISGNKSTGIPNEITKLQNMARKIIRDEIKEQKKSKSKITTITAFMTDSRTADICSTEFQKIINMSERDPENIKQKEIKYEELKKNENYIQALNEADIWNSTYFWSFEGKVLGEIPRFVTIEQLREKSVDPELDKLIGKIKLLAKDNQFFHWYIEFPEVFSTERGGFDCILTNPPWEELILKKKEFFSGVNNEIVSVKTTKERDKLIKYLTKTDLNLHSKFKTAYYLSRKTTQFLKNSSLYELSSRGKLNSYGLFVERVWKLISNNGVAGLIVPTGIISGFHMQDLFKALIKSGSTQSIFDFENKEGIFNIHRMFRFCLISIGGKNLKQGIIPMTFFIQNPMIVQNLLTFINENRKNMDSLLEKLPPFHKLIPMKQKDFELFNPNTLTCPIFSKLIDYKITKKIYKNSKLLLKKDNPQFPQLDIHRMINISDDLKSHPEYFLKEEDVKRFKKDSDSYIFSNNGHLYLPLYESKLVWIYDHRFATFEGCSIDEQNKGLPKQYHASKSNKKFTIKPRYWIDEKLLLEKKEKWEWKYNWFLSIRNITNATNQRTCIATIIPDYPTVLTLNLFLGINIKEALYLVSNLSTFMLDYCSRQKISGTHLNQYDVEQLPLVDYEKWIKFEDIIIPKCIELIYTTYELKNFASDLGFTGDPYKWDDIRRRKLMSELDGLFAHLYGLNKEEVEYILDTFPIIKEREINEYGEFFSKKLILEAYDKFSKQKELFE